MEMQYLYGAGEKSYISGSSAKYMAKGSTRPDIVTTSAMVEIKNYQVKNISNLIKALRRQVAKRIEHGPYNINLSKGAAAQQIILDLRGQKASMAVINDLVERVSAATKVPLSNIQVVTW
jgi:hypothetical protein